MIPASLFFGEPTREEIGYASILEASKGTRMIAIPQGSFRDRARPPVDPEEGSPACGLLVYEALRVPNQVVGHFLLTLCTKGPYRET